MGYIKSAKQTGTEKSISLSFYATTLQKKKVFNTIEAMFPEWVAQFLTKQMTLINAKLTWTKLNSSFTELNIHKQQTCIKIYNTEVKYIQLQNLVRPC